MPRSSHLRARVFGLERSLPRRCPVCAGWPTGILFRVDGVLQTNAGLPVEEAVLEPCPACGAGGTASHAGVGRWSGIRVIVGVDPTAI